MSARCVIGGCAGPLALAVAVLSLLGCEPRTDDEKLTGAEAQESLDESKASTSAALTMDGLVEISTHFTIGQGVQAAADELVSWVQSQIPCATAALEGTTVTIDFGDLSDSCVYRGRTYAGKAAITVKAVDGTVEVGHVWTDLTGGDVVLNGKADVTWAADASTGLTRRVVHEVTWTWENADRTGTGDRTWSFIDPAQGIEAGLNVDGVRTWTGPAGMWTLDIDDVRIRMQDPVPEGGSYTLTNPKDKTLTFVFERVDDKTIKVTISLGKHSFGFNVKSL